jgi:hypothetical protein
MGMTKKEIENYRHNEFPTEIDFLMAECLEIARQIDFQKNPAKKERIFELYQARIRTLHDRAKHYYDKRYTDFGIKHMRLLRLINSCKEIIRE